MLPSDELLELPIPRLCNPGALVAVWITNNARHLREAKEVLFPNWGLELVGEWYWIKVCSSAELVFSLESLHKKPYERLLIGRFGRKQGARAGSGPAKARSSAASPTSSPPLPLPARRVLISVPSAQHSRKPPLGDVLGPYLAQHFAAMEIFARNLHPGWTSFGNEALLFNQLCPAALSDVGPASLVDVEPAGLADVEPAGLAGVGHALSAAPNPGPAKSKA
jgi:N6-adenosine-specific RNA methylase IME4